MNFSAANRTLRRRLVVAATTAAAMLVPLPAVADLVDTVSRIKPSVVAVGTFQRTRAPAFKFLGTGFAVGDGMMIATNAHVVPDALADDQMETLAVAVPGEGQATIRKVSKLAIDKNHDLAVLRLEGGPPLPSLSVDVSSDRVREGQSIALTGFPIGSVLGLSPVTHCGIVAAITPIGIPQLRAQHLNQALIRRLSKDPFRIYQLDATTYPGNSGSPVFDSETGRLVGVINMVFVKSTKENILSDPSGISYAIPVEYLKALLKGLE
ncbi:S1 family peptidase [Aromatoleum aromaticum]|uniref:Probable serine protease, trypsin family n=1 Tax=Aromatoleum aromaticum (strain DSM 19018 / LMG 30748 / EbN1) TaxID=76114 RepID=Q5P974_AROAE|nr:serine protease [Aromatoleum aromaticum]NMG56185.1 trypsin-like serine protease [Aromatoleum aromaticum]CAI06135.1 probable serine protease, trypsin family [Aromatoleum aromaticum EbN1]